jgi:HlyD family secretion protein
MRLLFVSRSTYIVTALIAIVVVLILLYKVNSPDNVELVTATIDTGTVRELVSVSGIAEAKQTANLAFPVGGIVTAVPVTKGDFVTAGTVLVTLDSRSLYTERQDAAAALATTLANRSELLTGPTVSSQAVTSETLASQKATLATTKITEEQKIENAYRTLLSSGLTAYATDATEEAVAPVVSGTYRCDEEGVYTLDVYASGAKSGYSYVLSGIESGTYTAYTDQPGPLGTCGLQLIFDADSRYTNSRWQIEVPNTRSAEYIANRNAYNLAVTQAETAIALAERAVDLAEATATNQNAPARGEAIARADAAVTQAQARLNRIDVAIAERTLTAPFSGIITNLSILPGETVTTAPIVTLLAEKNFEVVARIPEIDIGKLQTGQAVEMMFDTRPEEIQAGTISFISPHSTQIDGVAYFEAVIQLESIPDWMRGGLNADIDIIIQAVTDTLRVPKRFVTETESGHFVRRQNDEGAATTSITVTMVGNDGYFAITGLTAGDVIVAPQ